MIDENITLAQRERVFAEGELAFKEGRGARLQSLFRQQFNTGTNLVEWLEPKPKKKAKGKTAVG